MAKKIESYNASYPAAFYEIGTIYSFYGRHSSKGTPASQEYISRYSAALKGLEAQQKSNAIQPVKGGSNTPSGRSGLTRYYAVVVGKSATSIEIMFLNEDNGKESYLTRKYAVSKSCTTDGKDLMEPSTRTNISGVQGETSKIGGITRVQGGGNRKVGGITRAGQNTTTSANVGGITRMKEKTSSSVNAPAVSSRSEPRVGGITRMKK